MSATAGNGAGGANSATPLWEKLGITPGCTLALVGKPDDFGIPDLPEGVRVLERAAEPLDVTVFFTAREKTLRGRMALLEPWIAPAGGLWIAWPKPASGRDTDLSVEVVQEIGLEHGLVENTVTSIDETWTALQFVRRLADR